MRRFALAFAVGLIGCGVGTPAAFAEGTIGDTSMASTGASTIGVGQGVPVFQGDASGGYTLSATAAESLTSWSFRSAGIAAGATFELAVLAPVDNTGTNWRLTAASPAETVTSASGTDAVMGPFALNPAITVDVGYRVALVPINGSDVPIEQGNNGQDGVRYFSQPFTGGLGSSQTLAPGSTMDNGQIVPVQATVAGSGAPVSTSAPYVTEYEFVLTCNPGGWTHAPTGYTYQWYLDGHAIANATDSTFTASSRYLGHNFTCAVTATNGVGSGSATSLARRLVGPPHFTVPSRLVVVGGRQGFVTTGTLVACKIGKFTPLFSNSDPYGRIHLSINETHLVGTGRHVRYVTTQLPNPPPDGYNYSQRVPSLPDGAEVSCTVKVTEEAGSVTASSNSLPFRRLARPPARPVPARCTAIDSHGHRHSYPCPPSIGGTQETGYLSCDPGFWRNSPTKFEYAWYVAGSYKGEPSSGPTLRQVLAGGIAARGPTYVAQPGELLGNEYFVCRVTATNSVGGTVAYSTVYMPSGQTFTG